MEYMIMSAAPAMNPDSLVAKDPQPLDELSARAVKDFEHFAHDHLRARKVEQFKKDDPVKFEILLVERFAHNSRLIHWPEVQVTEEEVKAITPEVRNKILVEAIHLGALGPYHPEHDEALRLHAESISKEREAQPVVAPE